MIEDTSIEETAALLAEDPRQTSPSVAIQTIDLWAARLDTSQVEGAAEVGETLESLGDQLQSNPLDGRAIGLTMRDLSGQTYALADSAQGLARLAAVLDAAGRQLAPDTSAASGQGTSVQ